MQKSFKKEKSKYYAYKLSENDLFTRSIISNHQEEEKYSNYDDTEYYHNNQDYYNIDHNLNYDTNSYADYKHYNNKHYNYKKSPKKPKHHSGSKLKDISRILSKKARIQNYFDSIKYEVPSLTKNLIFDLIEGSLECMICNEVVDANAEVWNCEKCHTIYHNHCIYDWIFKLNSQGTNKAIEVYKWTCPHCSNSYQASGESLPVYNCYCTKYYDALSKNNPRINVDLIPHGCGLECGKNICKHIKSCPLPCHPGPHVPCSVIDKIPCSCGKISKEIPCASNLSRKFSCGQICLKPLNCGKTNHTCKATCHEGDCDMYLRNKKCYECIAESKNKFSYFLKQLETKIKSECGEGRNLTSLADGLADYIFHGSLLCKEHYVEPNTDNNLKFLLKLLQISGKNLVENIKKFIPMCKTIVENSCTCKNKVTRTECYRLSYPEDIMEFLEISKERVTHQERCTKVCKAFKNCRNHRCIRMCCELNGVAIKNYSIEDPLGYHLCLITCDKLLNCGKHKCENYCHKGQCKPCANIIREGHFKCDCGKTVLEAPYQCGTVINCKYKCTKPSKCEHRCQLNCHNGECPPCEELTFKVCECRKNVINGVKCGNEEEVKCNSPCQEMLPCGVHFCELLCHVHTEEFDINYFCTMTCGRQMQKCQHKCQKRCHGEEDCPEYECDAGIKISCKCKIYSRNIKCGEYKKLLDEDPTYILPCVEECKKQERLKKIEQAFDGLLKISEEKQKKLYNKKSEDEGITIEGLENKVKIVDVKYEHNAIYLAKKKISLIIEAERTVEKALKNLSQKLEISRIEKKYYPAVAEYLKTYYNIKTDKVKKGNELTYNLVLTDCSEALLPKFKLSLFGLLFKHHIFAEKKMNNINVPNVYHPFEYTIFIKNYRMNVTMEEIEHYLNSLTKLSKSDYYVDELQRGECYVHFFDIDIGKRVYQQLRTKPSQFQEAYEIEYDPTEVKYDQLYLYLKSDDYLEYLNEGTKDNYIVQKLQGKLVPYSSEDEIDEEGFVKIKSKKNKVK